MRRADNHNRVAFVTGGAQGLGAAIARELAADGATVVVADVNARGAHDVAAGLTAAGMGAQATALDVRDAGALRAAIEATISEHGRLDVLVNNAGVTPVRDFFELTVEEWDDVLAINLRSAFVGCQVAGRHMRARQRGRIINLASIAGQIGSRIAGVHYSVSKGGITTLTKVAAKELAPFGVTVNAIAPAVVRVPVMAALPQDRLRELIDSIPVGRVGEAEEVAAVARFIASDDAGYITGATFDVNGGQLMR
jgi:3-oxoacyl-[acyl-carrier protein] reductase